MNEKSTILMSERDGSGAAQPRVRPAPWPFIMGSGIILGLIGWVDVLLLWYPIRFGDAEWEFGTVSATFDALPLATIGLVAVAVAARIASGPVVRKTVAGFAIVAVGIFVVAYILFVLSFLQGWANIPEQASWMLVRAGAKASLYAFAYTVLYVWLAVMLLRSPAK